MTKQKSWKRSLSEKLYCRPEWNKRLLCTKRSFEEVYRVLNSGCGGRRQE